MSTSDFSINLEACRFCFRVVNFMSAINESIKIYFKELMREEAKTLLLIYYESIIIKLYYSYWRTQYFLINVAKHVR